MYFTKNDIQECITLHNVSKQLKRFSQENMCFLGQEIATIFSLPHVDLHHFRLKVGYHKHSDNEYNNQLYNKFLV